MTPRDAVVAAPKAVAAAPAAHDTALVEAIARRVVELQAQRDRPPRLALSVAEACQAIGCGWDFWKAHIAPEVRLIRRGSRKLVPVAELERWLESSAERVLPDRDAGLRAARTPRFAGTSGEAGARIPGAPRSAA